MYRDHQKVSGGPPGGATCPRGLNGLNMGGNHALVGWCAPSPRPKAQGEWEGANPRSRWALRPTLVAPPSLPPLAAP